MGGRACPRGAVFPGTGAGWPPGPGGVRLVCTVLPGAVRAFLASLPAGRSAQGSQAHGAVRSAWAPARGLPLQQPPWAVLLAQVNPRGSLLCSPEAQAPGGESPRPCPHLHWEPRLWSLSRCAGAGVLPPQETRATGTPPAPNITLGSCEGQ